MIVFDVSTLVGAAIRRDSTPERALRRALHQDRTALSEAVLTELLLVFDRPRLARFLDPDLRLEVRSALHAFATFFGQTVVVNDCRNPKDNKYLELALAAEADAMVSSDADRLVLHPWRGVQTVSASGYLASIGDGA